MTQGAMTVERFAAIVDAYGARRDRWPADERGAADALLARSAAARACLADAVALDLLLDTVPAPAPMPVLRAALLAAAPRARPRAWPGRLLDGWRGFLDELGGWQVGPVLAASLVLGLFAGALLSRDPTGAAEPGLLQLAQFDDGFEEY